MPGGFTCAVLARLKNPVGIANGVSASRTATRTGTGAVAKSGAPQRRQRIDLLGLALAAPLRDRQGAAVVAHGCAAGFLLRRHVLGRHAGR